MRARLVVLVVVVSGLTIVLLAAPGRVAGATLYVRCPQPGFVTIQSAVDAASPGDTVYVCKGTYNEAVFITKPLSLVGEDRNGTIIGGNPGFGVTVRSDWVNVTGFSILNATPAGIVQYGANHTRFTGNRIVVFDAAPPYDGIIIRRSRDFRVSDTEFGGPMFGVGVVLDTTGGGIVENNSVPGPYCTAMVGVEYSRRITVANNTAGPCWSAVYIFNSQSIILRNNTMVGGGVWLEGDSLANWDTHTIDTTNTVNGKPVEYWADTRGGRVPSGAGQVILAGASGATLEGLDVVNVTEGVTLGFSSGNIVVNGSVSRTHADGIRLYASSGNRIANNVLTDYNVNSGIILVSSSGNVIANNTASSRYGAVTGISLFSSLSNTIVGNVLADNARGDSFGIFLRASTFNSLHHNTFLRNVNQAYDDGYNVWDDGYPSGGNRWSDYSGADAFRGPAQDRPGCDAIGDTPRPIGGGPSIDRYPLVGDRALATAPRNLSAAGGNREIALTWELPAGDGCADITGYRLYRGTASGQETFRIDVGGALAHTDTGLANGQTYFYRVAAVNWVGEGARSNEASATPAGPPAPVTSLRLGQPNYTAGATYVTSGTPVGFSAVDRSGAGLRNTTYRIDGGAWVNYTATGAFTLAGEGAHRIEWFSEDFAGNVEPVSNATLLVDDTPPTTTLSPGDPKYMGPDTFVTSATPWTVQVTDGGATPVGLAGTEYRIDGGAWTTYAAPFAVGGEGRHAVDCRSSDLLGNAETVRTLEIVVDDTPPTVNLSVGSPRYPWGDTFVTYATPLTLAAADGGAVPVGVAAIEYRIDGASWTAYASPFVLGSEGAHAIEYRASDLLGNVAPERAFSLVVDNTAPSLSASVGVPSYQGATLYVTSATPISISAADGGPAPVGLGSLSYRVDGGPWSAYANPFTLPATDGPRHVEYAGSDRLGNRASAALDLVVDDAPPTTTIAPAAGPYTEDTIFTLSATDQASGVARTEVRVDDGAWTTYAAPITLPEGPHTIGFRSVDHLGNTEAERVLTVTIESGPPSPSPEPNWKPLVAATFAALLAVAGAWSARRAPWPTGRRRRLRAFALAALPFVVAEAGTGVVSLLTGFLAIPPVLGVGTAVDVGILAAGVALLGYRVRGQAPLE